MEWLVVVAAFVVGALVHRVLIPLFAEYGKQKGKNLADKEDIAVVTRLVEEVKQENQLILEQMRAQHQLRLAAAEKRLQAHQEAFAHWRRLLANVHTDHVGKTVLDCQEWWERNCLFLTAAARDAFNKAYSAANSHHVYARNPVRNEVTAQLAKDNWADIMAAGPLIVSGVELPSLGRRDEEVVGETAADAQQEKR